MTFRSIMAKGIQSLSKHFLHIFGFLQDRMFLCNSSFLMHLHLLGPWEVLLPWPFRLQFSKLPRGPADDNGQEIMFDLYSQIYLPVTTFLCFCNNSFPSRRIKMSHDTTKRVFGNFRPVQTQTSLRRHRS